MKTFSTRPEKWLARIVHSAGIEDYQFERLEDLIAYLKTGNSSRP